MLDEASCGHQDTSVFNFVLSILILFGILLSYIPQHWRIISKRSSKGLSPFYILLGTTSGSCAFAAIVTLPASQASLACCKVVDRYECFSAVLGVAQIGVQWACFIVILLLFLLFFPSATPIHDVQDRSTNPSYRSAIIVFVLCVMQFIIAFLLSAYFIVLGQPRHLQIWSNAIGIMGTVLAAVQFLPQIWTTWKLQTVGSLSIASMCIQTPGSIVWVASLAARLGFDGWSTWGIYLVTGILQGILLGMCVTYEARRKKKEIGERDTAAQVLPHEDDNLTATERTGLLADPR